MSNEVPEEEKSVLYNFGAEHLALIISLIRDAGVSYNKGEALGYYRVLKRIKTQIIPRISMKQKTVLNIIEEKINGIINKQEPTEYESFNIEENRLEQLNKKIMSILVYYDETLMTILDIRGFLVPLKTSKTSIFGRKSSAEI